MEYGRLKAKIESGRPDIREQVAPKRCKKFKRHDLIKIFKDLGFKEGAEIGVAEGKFSEYICDTMGEGYKHHAIDPWSPNVEDRRSQLIGGRHSEKRYQQALTRLLPKKATIYRLRSIDAVMKFEPHSLDFVYIDGCHNFDSIMFDLIEWSKIVKPGGIVSGHDYYHFRWAGVVPAVDTYTRQHEIYDWYITDEHEPSFFWEAK